MPNNFFNNSLIESLSDFDYVIYDKVLAKINSLSNENKIYIVGNGGSAAIASHFTVDFIKNSKIKCVNFTDTSIITCFSNDYGYENWVAKAVELYCNKDDLFISISSSGESKNIINGINQSKKIGMFNITLTGFEKNNSVSRIGDINYWVNSNNYNNVETNHLIFLLNIIESIR